MTYNDIVILIPCHSLDDFPTELDEKDAESLLNAFAVAWHPELLASTRVIPSWHRSDEPPQFLADRLILVPKTSEDWLPYGWIEEAEANGATVVSGKIHRDEFTEAALAPLHAGEGDTEGAAEEASPAVELSPDLVADFYALGFCYIQLELLTRCMHHFSSLDEATIQREAIAAADAALADDAEAARAHLKACFEVLLENRERFYPIDCYLIDLCLVAPEWANDNLKAAIQDEQPLNLLITAQDLEAVAEKDPELISALKKSCENQETEVIGGEREEIATPVVAVESLIWQLQSGTDTIRELAGRAPTTWARRRFGLASLLPMLLHRSGFHSALHLVLDDGVYPDYEQSKIHWEGADGTILDAYSRIPLSAEGSASYLRFPQRMAESMEEDQVGALMFARWPDVKSPFYEDLKRIHRYAPVLGSFVLLNDFFQNTESSGRHSSYDAREYLSPFLSQLVAMRKPDPLSRFIDYFQRYDAFTAGRWFQTVAQAIYGKRIEETTLLQLETQIENAHPDAEEETIQSAREGLADFYQAGVNKLAEIILQGADPSQPGVLLMNSLSFNRRVVVDLPDFSYAPEARDYIKATQFDEQHKKAIVEIPGAGFVWLQPGKMPAPAVKSNVPIAEPLLLRNEYFEVHIHEETGGIAQIKEYGRKPNRLSQQLSYRFPYQRNIPRPDPLGDWDEKTPYAAIRGVQAELTCAGPGMGEIVTTGELYDQVSGNSLATFRQTFQLWRGRPILDVKIELNVQVEPEGNPWDHYYAARFAWGDSTASLTRSLLESAHAFQGERFEGPHYFEIAEGEERVTILNHGLPFHRKTGPRMLDSMLVVEGETRREFEFSIALNQNLPMQLARNVMVPAGQYSSPAGPPRMGDQGWLFHVSTSNVQITRVMDLKPDELNSGVARSGFAVRLIETEGLHRSIKLRCFKSPVSARQRDFQGKTVVELPIEDDAVLVEMSLYEIAEIEIYFEESN
jgi:alpha-mannosidase